MKKTFYSRITTILVILSISIMIFPMSEDVMATIGTNIENPSNTTLPQPSQPQQQPQETQLQRFTIPKDSDGNPSESSVSQFRPQNNDKDDLDNSIVLLSQNYDEDKFADRLVGELLNNGSQTIESVHVSASFYDEDGRFLGTASGYTEPYSITPGGRAGFDIMITSDAVQDDTETYEFTIEWRDDDFDQHSIRIAGEQASEIDDDDDDNNGHDGNGKDIRLIIVNQGNQPQTDPRFDKKYDSIDWQDDDPSKNLSVEEMDKILEEKEQNNNNDDGGNSDQDNSSNENGGSDGGSSDGGSSDGGSSDGGSSDGGSSDGGSSN